MEDPNPVTPVLYDPAQHRQTAQAQVVPVSFIGRPQRSNGVEVRQTGGGSASSARQAQPQPQPQQPPEPPRAPRRGVTVQPVPGTDQLIIVGDPADIAEIEQIIQYITRLAAVADTDIRIFSLEFADATSVVNILRELYRGVNVRAGSTGLITAQQQQQAQGSVLVISLPRQNAVLVAAPAGRMEEIEKTIRKLDLPISPEMKFKSYPLKRASATQVAQAIQQFYTGRFPNEAVAGTAAPGAQAVAAGGNQVKVQADPTTNSVWVQASPSDQEEIARLIRQMDTPAPSAVNELRIIPLKNAIATDVANTLRQAIPVQPATTTQPTQQTPSPFGFPFFPQQQTQPRTTTPMSQRTIQFVTPDGRQTIESGLLEGVTITPDVNTNSLIISAPPASLELIQAIVQQLDVPPAAALQAEIKVFTLKKADASILAQVLVQLFYGTGIGGVGGLGGLGGLGGIGGLGGLGGLGLGGLAGQLGGAGTTGLAGSQFLTLGGNAPASLRLAIEPRTNSIIVAGGRSDLVLIEALITRLDEAEITHRINCPYRLRNTNATDIANTLTTLLNAELTSGYGTLSPYFLQIEKQAFVVAEPISNQILISATPQYFDEILRLVKELDADQPQVVIQVMIAQVRLTGNEEFGVELGLQSPILFDRSVLPATGFLGNGSVNYSAGTPPLVPQGVTVNNTINPAAFPGMNFNNSAFFSNPLPANPVVRPAVLAPQGLTNFNLGRTSAGANVGGFVFSAASESVNLLIRALQTQQRIQILSRPQISAYHNQPAAIQIGSQVPIITGVNVTATAGVTNLVEQTQVGIILTVTPRISPDGYVIMQVTPQISSISPSTVDLGNGVLGTIIDVTAASTVISAMDGQTVVIGGLIQQSDTREERKVPWFGDLPYIGAAFRYRTESRERRELLILLTPRIVRNRIEAERVKREEAARMSWFLGDVEMIHGPLGLEDFPPLPPIEKNLMPGAPLQDGSVIPIMPREVEPPSPPSSPPAPAPMPTPVPAPSKPSPSGSAAPTVALPPERKAGIR
ncbi:MAG: hypothetical protein NZM31_07805 [Gemmatales bacterium]|nr:hypothetical protein [Gemmatales bacterium]